MDRSALARDVHPGPAPGAGVEWEDVLQESLSAAWRKRSQFDGTRGTARNWLLAITAEQASKDRRRRIPEPTDSITDTAAPAVDGAADLDVGRALDLLTGRQRLAVTLHYFLGLAIADIAAVMRCSGGTVKSTLRDGRAKLRATLGEDYR